MELNITVTTTGANIATGAASNSIAIPVASSGEIPRYIRLASLNACYAKLGLSAAVAAVAGDILINVGDTVILAVPRGVTHIAAIQDAVAGKLNVTPLEDC